VLGALAGAAVFTLAGFELGRLAYSLGWWRWALVDMPKIPALLFTMNVLSYASILALVSWRVTRRFGWRGQLTFISIMSIVGPARDLAGAALTGLVVIASGVMPLLGWAIAWACNVALMQAVMRLVAGGARADHLAGPRPDFSR
jgi:hypothetical protein